MTQNHSSLTIRQSGLLLDPMNPFIGTLPGGIIDCSCCDSGVLEIKCPFFCKEKTFDERAQDRSFFMEKDASGDFVFKKDHAYYYQVQLQMKLSNADYCDFLVWREDSIIIQRISLDRDCISAALDRIPTFVKCCILPELVGKYLTKPSDSPSGLDDATSSSTADSQPLITSVACDSHATNDNMDDFTSDDGTGDFPGSSISLVVGDDTTAGYSYNSSMAEDNQEDLETVEDDLCVHSSQDDDLNTSQDDDLNTSQDGLWCYCQQYRDDKMVGYDNDNCSIQWFHLSCLNLTVEQLPSGDWFCPDCC